jgi:hypothetical protein
VYIDRPRTFEALKTRIQEECNKIIADKLRAVTNGTKERAHNCLALNGQQFEHMAMIPEFCYILYYNIKLNKINQLLRNKIPTPIITLPWHCYVFS